MTERARYIFTVKEFEGGQPWIYMEPFDTVLSPLAHGFIGFDLAEGTTLEQAHELATLLNSKLIRTSYTDLTKD
jgi:hypothetical protein